MATFIACCTVALESLGVILGAVESMTRVAIGKSDGTVEVGVERWSWIWSLLSSDVFGCVRRQMSCGVTRGDTIPCKYHSIISHPLPHTGEYAATLLTAH